MGHVAFVERIVKGQVPQIGVIVWGGGLNRSFWIAKARSEGYLVYEFPGENCARLYRA